MRNTKKSVVFSLIVIFIGTVLPLLMIEIVLRFFPILSSTGAVPINDQNPVIRYTPNQSFTFSKGWQFDIVNAGRINNYGFVNEQDYAKHVEDRPVVVIGDSYVEAMMALPADGTGETVPSAYTQATRIQHRDLRSATCRLPGLRGIRPERISPLRNGVHRGGNDFDESLANYSTEPRPSFRVSCEHI